MYMKQCAYTYNGPIDKRQESNSGEKRLKFSLKPVSYNSHQVTKTPKFPENITEDMIHFLSFL